MKTTRWLFYARRFVPLALLITGLLAARPAYAVQTFGMTLVTSNEARNYTLTWEQAIDGSSQTAKATYRVFEVFGFRDAFATGAVTKEVFDKLTVDYIDHAPGSRCFTVSALNFNNPPTNTVLKEYARSNQQCHSYIHCNGGGNIPCVTRVDGNGTQLGFGHQWKWTYNLDRDSEMIIKIWKAGTSFTNLFDDSVEGNGFSTTTAQVPVKTIVDSVARSGELANGTVSNEDTWDMRDSSGATVANGIYFVHFTAINPLQTPTTRAAIVFTIPVDTLRFTKFETKGIDPKSALGEILYSITGDASVRIVIAKPGHKFTVDTSSRVQALDITGFVIDETGASVVKVIEFNRKAGDHTEFWDGSDLLGSPVPAGIYGVGVSASDGYGNSAVNIGGNDNTIVGTIPVERTADQTALDNTAPTILNITVNGDPILEGAPEVSGSFASIVVTLSETAGTGTNTSTITVTHSVNGLIEESLLTSLGDVITWSTSTVQSTLGTYTVAVIARDLLGNSATSKTFTFSVPDTAQAGAGGGGGGPATQTSSDFKSSLNAFPNPARGGAPTQVDFKVINAGTVEIDIFTLLGEKIFHKTQATNAASVNTFDWTLVNDGGGKVGSGVYIVRLTLNDGDDVLTATKKVMVIR